MNIFLILSLTWFLANHLKNKSILKSERKNCIKLLNSFYLTVAVVSVALIIIYQNAWLPSQAVKPPYSLYNLLPFLVYVAWIYFLLSRCNEIFFAFLMDASDKIKREDNTSSLEFNERLKLALKSYFELIINFSILFSLMPSSFWETGKAATDIIDALYYSAATITTLSDGTVAPEFWITKFLAIYEIFCGFSLLIVCFTVYTSRAIGDSPVSVVNGKDISSNNEINTYSVSIKKQD